MRAIRQTGSEVIEVFEWQRRLSAEDKLRILTDASALGAAVATVSDRHGISRNLVDRWLRLSREGRVRGPSLGAKPNASFVPRKGQAEAAGGRAGSRLS
jgi:transposase-like protein